MGIDGGLDIGLEMLNALAVYLALIEHLAQEIGGGIFSVGSDEDIGQVDGLLLHGHLERGLMIVIEMDDLSVGAIAHVGDFDGTLGGNNVLQYEPALSVTDCSLTGVGQIDGGKRSGAQ